MSIPHEMDEEEAFRLMMEALAASDPKEAAKWLEIMHLLQEQSRESHLH